MLQQMPKILNLKQLLQKRYTYLENMPEKFKNSFGELTNNFNMIIWGDSGNGKTNLVMQITNLLILNGDVLYVSLEEGHESTMQLTAMRQLEQLNQSNHKIRFSDYEMDLEELRKTLSKRQSARFVIIDSIQYLNISYEDYKNLKSDFPNKSFLFISHQKGKIPDGSTSNKVRYDVPIKVRVEGYVAFVTSRYGGNKPFVIWEEGAKKYWGKKFKKTIQ